MPASASTSGTIRDRRRMARSVPGRSRPANMRAWPCSSPPTSPRTSPAPLLRGVSLKLERRERLTVAGPNGSGKTTLLRMLAGELSLDGGELTLAKGARLALHDQRPPRERGLSLRDYVLSGAAELVALERELAELESRWRRGRRPGRARPVCARPGAPRARRRLPLARPRASTVVRGLGFADPDLDRSLRTFSGGELTRALARPRAGGRSRPAAARRAHQPPRHRRAGVAGVTLAGLDAAVVLVAHDRWFLEAVGTAVLELEGGRGALLRRALARLAQGACGARAGPGPRGGAPGRPRSRAWSASSSASAPGTRARQAQARVKRLDRIARVEAPGRGAGARLRLPAARAQRPRRVRARGRRGRGRGPHAARARRAVARARRARLARRAERRGQDHADRDARRPARAGGGQAAARAQRRARLPLPARRRARARHAAPCSTRPSGPPA